MNEAFALICSTDKAFRKQKPGTIDGLSSLALPSEEKMISKISS